MPRWGAITTTIIITIIIAATSIIDCLQKPIMACGRRPWRPQARFVSATPFLDIQ
jgi:hypothetical protein